MKFLDGILVVDPGLSPPARGAWVEMLHNKPDHPIHDRRPPHGGRGLKSSEVARWEHEWNVAPRTGGVG